MTVNVTRDAINLRDKLSEVDKPSGIAGEAILRSETPQEVFNYIGAGRRNLIINGAMQVAQRGTSATGLGNGDNGYHTIDRYRFSESGTPTGEFTMSQSTDAPDGFGYSMKFECTTADTSMASGDRFQVSTRIEGQNCQQLKYGTSDAQKLSLSFWVKSNKTGTYCIGVVQVQNSAVSFVREYTVNSANTWEYKTLTIDGDTSGVINNDNGNNLELGFALAAGTGFHSTAGIWTGEYEYATSNQVNLADNTGNTWQITGVQLELGKVATPFEHRSYGEELALCQRYYTKFSFPATTSFFPSHRQTTDVVRSTVTTPVPMRTTPSINTTGQPYIRYHWDNGSSFLIDDGTSLSVVSSSLDVNRFTLSSSGVTGVGTNIGTVFAYSGTLECDAEL